MKLSQNSKPISYLKANTAEVIERLKKSSTHDGYPEWRRSEGNSIIC
jgi:hypothetical protein